MTIPAQLVGRPLWKEPTYKLQRRALSDADAASELAYRHAVEEASPRIDRAGSYFKRIRAAFLLGLRGAESPWRIGGGGNFARPLNRAHRAGKALRDEMLAEAKQAVEAFE